MHRQFLALGTPTLVLALLTCSGSSCAEAPRPEVSPIEWRWRRFQAWEYPATVAALGGAFYLRFIAPSHEPNWSGGILFDDWVRDRVAIEKRSTRGIAAGFSDIVFYGAMGYRLIDSVIVPGLGRGNWDTVHQMAMIDLEVFGFVAITLWGTQAFIARERPYVNRCGGPSSLPNECGEGDSDRNRSFFAGHPTVGLAAAGLTCVHHAHLPLYGGSGDIIACGLMVGAGVMNGLGRVVADKHYASDLTVGFGVGAFAGWVLPELLHYAHPRPAPSAPAVTTSPEPTSVRAILLPSWSQGPGLSLLGIF